MINEQARQAERFRGKRSANYDTSVFFDADTHKAEGNYRPRQKNRVKGRSGLEKPSELERKPKVSYDSREEASAEPSDEFSEEVSAEVSADPGEKVSDVAELERKPEVEVREEVHEETQGDTPVAEALTGREYYVKNREGMEGTPRFKTTTETQAETATGRDLFAKGREGLEGIARVKESSVGRARDDLMERTGDDPKESAEPVEKVAIDDLKESSETDVERIGDDLKERTSDDLKESSVPSDDVTEEVHEKVSNDPREEVDVKEKVSNDPREEEVSAELDVERASDDFKKVEVREEAPNEPPKRETLTGRDFYLKNKAGMEGLPKVKTNEIQAEAPTGREFYLKNREGMEETPKFKNDRHELLNLSLLDSQKHEYIMNQERQFSGLFKATFHNRLGRFAFILNKRRVTSIELSKTLAYMLGYSIQTIDRSLHATTNIDFHNGLHSFFVYSNICDLSILGNCRSNLLRVMRVQGEYGDVISEEFNPIQYIPILNKNVHTVEIMICDSTGAPIEFQYGNVIIVLHCRRRP
uniref:Tetratricopeptide repeat protein n=2 Tax=Steinernema glaseri TaxID=37863 RepID=A0A1I7ZU33_9BILA